MEMFKLTVDEGTRMSKLVDENRGMPELTVRGILKLTVGEGRGMFKLTVDKGRGPALNSILSYMQKHDMHSLSVCFIMVLSIKACVPVGESSLKVVAVLYGRKK